MKYKDFDALKRKAEMLKSIAHPIRLGVVELLSCHETLSVGELTKRLRCEQSLLSHQLSGMRNLGILKAEKEGQVVYYSLLEKNFIPVIKAISKCECNPE